MCYEIRVLSRSLLIFHQPLQYEVYDLLRERTKTIRMISVFSSII